MSYTLNLETDEEAKEMQKVALILEGGAKRGVFTSGVLDYLMEQEYYIPHVIGVSAGFLQCSGLCFKAGREDKGMYDPFRRGRENNQFSQLFPDEKSAGHGSDF